jgi:hypothetical protein
VYYINILKLAKYFYVEALPASRMDVGDVDKLEYQVSYHMIGCQQAGWTFGELMPVGRLDVGEKQTGARYATLYKMNNHTPCGFPTGIT